MKNIKIEDEEIIGGLRDTRLLNLTGEQAKIHQMITGGKLSIDDQGNIIAERETGEKFWIRTCPDCYRVGSIYNIRIVYSVYCDPKYTDLAYKFSK